MTDCGICLDVLRNPVSTPCGHVHCEKCLRSHINAGTDALKSTCPTCRKPFHIATPDFAFVPQKYYDFIMPCVRKVYMDIPSVVALKREVERLSGLLDSMTKDNDHLRQHCKEYQSALDSMQSEKDAIIEREEDARAEADNLCKKYETLKRRYWRVLAGDDAYSSSSSQALDAPREAIPKLEEHSISLHDLNPISSRPKRSLPKSRLSDATRYKEDKLTKRRRKQRDSDVGSTSQVAFKYEDDDDE